LKAVNRQDVSECIRILDEVETAGRELSQFVIDFIWYLRNLLLIKTTENINDIIIDISTENLMLLKQEAESIEDEILMRYIRVFSELSNQIRYAARKRVPLEIALIKLCKPQMERDYESLINRIKILEDKLEKGTFIKSGGKSNDSSKESAIEETEPIKRQEILPEALPEDLKRVAASWNKLITQISKKAPAMASVLRSATLSIDDNKGVMIVVADTLDKDMIDRETNMKVIHDTISDMLQKTVQINVRCLDKDKESMSDVVDLTKIIKVPIQYE
jgi:DNA polymerase-3 subunit gamma/tau